LSRMRSTAKAERKPRESAREFVKLDASMMLPGTDLKSHRIIDYSGESK
jgi:hypothetical protein